MGKSTNKIIRRHYKHFFRATTLRVAKAPLAAPAGLLVAQKPTTARSEAGDAPAAPGRVV